MRGRGLSDCRGAPYSMGDLISDVDALLDHLNVCDCFFAGLSIDGMITQGLATKHLNLICTMVLSNTAAKIATPAIWQDRIDSIRRTGICPVSDTTMSHWLSPKMRASSTMSPWHNMMPATRPEGYIGCAHAISVTDFIATTSTLQLPFMGIAADHDGSPPQAWSARP